MYLLVGIIVLGVLIFVHELGHFLLAKLNRVGVLEFAIGFGKPLIQRQLGDTLYSIRAIPLGGYVRMVGDDIRQVSGEMEEGGFDDEDLGEMSDTARALLMNRDRWFLEKGFFAKSAIVIAGPGFNILFAILLSALSFYFTGLASEVSNEPIVGVVLPTYPAEKAGMKAGDIVISIDGNAVKSFDDIREHVFSSAGRAMVFKIERESEENGNKSELLDLTFAGTTETTELDILEGNKKEDDFPRIGIGPTTSEERVSVSLSGALYYGALYTYDHACMILRGLRAMITGQVSTRHISGPIGIFDQISKSAQRGIEHLVYLTVVLSVSLAILNLLPIPILDGGHLLFFIIEALKGGRVSLKAHELANQLGMAILLLLMVFAVGNDIWGIVSRYTTEAVSGGG